MSEISELQLPPDYTPQVPLATMQEIKIVKLAREIAMELRDLNQTLQLHQVTSQEFEQLKRHPYFVKVLQAELEDWQSAKNTHQRVKLKSSAMMEEWLPTLYKRMVDPKEDLLKVIKGGELTTKLAGMGQEDAKAGDPSDRVTITINMGADNKLEFSKASLPAKVIDHDATELQQGFEASLNVSQD